MRNFSFTVDALTAVPIPSEPGDSWVADSTARLAAAHELDDAQAQALGSALASSAASSTHTAGQAVALFDAGTMAFSLLRIVVVEREISPDERVAFLWPPSVMPPQVWLTPPTPMGVGCSSTILEDPASGRASVRWLFMPAGASVLVTLGPLSLQSTLALGAIAESILETLVFEGIGATLAADFDPAALIERSDKDGRTWRN